MATAGPSRAADSCSTYSAARRRATAYANCSTDSDTADTNSRRSTGAARTGRATHSDTAAGAAPAVAAATSTTTAAGATPAVAAATSTTTAAGTTPAVTAATSTTAAGAAPATATAAATTPAASAAPAAATTPSAPSGPLREGGVDSRHGLYRHDDGRGKQHERKNNHERARGA
jgi:hypothetical protein